MDSMILTLLIFLPVLGAAIMVPVAKTMGKENPSIFKWIALIVTGIQFLLAIILYKGFDPAVSISASPYTVQVIGLRILISIFRWC